MSRTNVVILSKNRANEGQGPNGGETASHVDVSLSNALTCADNEYFTINVSSFHMIKSFYAIQNNLNNKFFIILEKQDGTQFDEFVRYIPEGNYDVRTMLKTLQELCFGMMTVEYDRKLNKFSYTRLELESDGGEENIADFDMYIKPIDSGLVLGIDNNTKKFIDYTPTLSDYFVNISGFASLLINLNGLSIANNYINHTDEFAISKMIGIIDIASVSAMDSIIYTDACNTYKYKINDKIIKEFAITITNEDGKAFPQMSDYIANVLFEKHVNPVNYESLFSILMERVNDLIFFITYFLQLVGGPANSVQ